MTNIPLAVVVQRSLTIGARLRYVGTTVVEETDFFSKRSQTEIIQVPFVRFRFVLTKIQLLDGFADGSQMKGFVAGFAAVEISQGDVGQLEKDQTVINT